MTEKDEGLFQVIVTKLRPIDGRGSWLAVAEVAIGDILIDDCKLFGKKDGELWVAGPSREYTTKAGEKKYVSLVTFSGDLKDAVRDAIVAEYNQSVVPDDGNAAPPGDMPF